MGLIFYKIINHFTFFIKRYTKSHCKSLIIDNNRLTYINQSFDVTIIETKKYDKINEKSFFDLDKQIFQENAHNLLKNNQIYLLHYPKGNEMEISPGIIQNITIDNTKIEHLCSSSGGSLGAPLINKNTHQVLGIHKGEKGKKYNIGTLLKEPIEKFKEEIKTKNIDIEKYIQENENIEIEEKKEIINEENKSEETNEIKGNANDVNDVKDINDKENIEEKKEIINNENKNIEINENKENIIDKEKKELNK